MWIKTNGNDTWAIDLARATLYFSDGTNMVAEQACGTSDVFSLRHPHFL